MNVFKFFNKFKSFISIVVTDFQLSENKSSDADELRKRFAHFKVKDMKFIEKGESKESIE